MLICSKLTQWLLIALAVLQGVDHLVPDRLGNERRTDYAAMSATYAQNEGSCRAALSNGFDPKNAPYYAHAAGCFGRMKEHYQRAAASPWSLAPPEPRW